MVAEVRGTIGGVCHPDRVSVIPLLSRPVYLYSEVDRLVGLRPGTARRWINGYERAGKSYVPILRTEALDDEWVTWGEFVETRILSEYRDKNIPTARLREAVSGLREMFNVAYPLAHLRPYLAAESGELALDRQRLDPSDDEGLMILRTKQLLLEAPAGPSSTAQRWPWTTKARSSPRNLLPIRDFLASS